MLCPLLPSLSSLVKPRPNHKPPCVISQQCFWPPGLMAQCSPYDMRCLKGRSALLFSSNLIPKLFKHRGFSSKYRMERVYVFVLVCVCVCLYVGERQRQKGWVDSMQSNVSFGIVTFSVFSLALLHPFSPLLPVSPFSCGPYMPLSEGVTSLGMNYIFTQDDKLKDLLKQEQMSSLFGRGRSIKFLAIRVSLSATLVLRMGHINHAAKDLCGHRGSLQTAAWDTNRPSSC